MQQSTDSPLKFPCRFPIKALGRAQEDLDARVIGIVRRHIPDLGEGAVRTQASRQGKYVSVTVTVIAESRTQLDAVYRALSADEHILMVL